MIVGSEEKRFKAHLAYLSQSPVFEAMCRHSFKEGQTLQIELPADQPKIIAVILKYLYAGDFCGYDSVASGSDQESIPDQLAEIYVTAEIYHLRDLKDLVIKKLKIVMDVKERLPAFLSTAKKIYAGIPDSDNAFRTFFREIAADMHKLDEMSEADRAAFDRATSDGGLLTADLIAALRSQHEKYKKELEEAQAIIARFKDFHGSYHHSCLKCIIEKEKR